jgi:hypothetical protein
MASKPPPIDAPPTPARSTPASPLPAGFFRLLDTLLRDRERFFDAVFDGREVGRWLSSFLLASVALSAFYGLSMGLLGFNQGFGTGLMQMIASAIKVPCLFLLSTAVCFPVLYIVQVLMGARLAFAQTLALILMALTLNGVLLASCAPIVFFFVVTGADYHFIKLLHVAIFGFSGIWSMMSLWLGLRTMCEKSNLYPPIAVTILKVWIIVFAFVGTQMAWSLRPFVGSPDMEFQIFRKQESNFYAGLWSSVTSLGQKATKDETPEEGSE